MWCTQASELCYIEARRPITDIMEKDELGYWQRIPEKRCGGYQPLELCYNADMMEMWRARALVALISEKRCIGSQPPELYYNIGMIRTSELGHS